MTQGYRREFFAGSNSCYGFWPYFSSIPGKKGMKRLLIKGGPGFGKSTLIKKIGAYFEKEGMDTEWFRCPSDPDSMDALTVPQADFCIIDATAPHALVPEQETDEIINLWEFWNPEKQEAAGKAGASEEGERLDGQYEKWNLRILQQWQREETEWWKTLRGCGLETTVWREMQEKLDSVRQELVFGVEAEEKAVWRHFYAAGYTPDGIVNLSGKILGEDWKCIVLSGQIQPALESMMKRLVRECEEKRMYVECCHSPLEPQKVDMLVLPAYKRAVFVRKIGGIDYTAGVNAADMETVQLEEGRMKHPELAFMKYAAEDIITGFLACRRERHQAAEKRYAAAMDYEGLDEVAGQLLERFGR